jgi:hypothetical protein
MADSSIAMVAQYATNLTRFVIVVYNQACSIAAYHTLLHRSF